MSKPLEGGLRPRTLVVHHRSGIGDLVWHLPYLRAIAERSAGGKASVMARPSSRAVDVLAAENWVDEVIEYDHRPRKSEHRRVGMTVFSPSWPSSVRCGPAATSASSFFPGGPATR